MTHWQGSRACGRSREFDRSWDKRDRIVSLDTRIRQLSSGDYASGDAGSDVLAIMSQLEVFAAAVADGSVHDRKVLVRRYVGSITMKPKERKAYVGFYPRIAGLPGPAHEELAQGPKAPSTSLSCTTGGRDMFPDFASREVA